MKNRSRIKRGALIVMVVAAVSAFGACHEANHVLNPDRNDPFGPYQLTFSLDASFRAPHGGQPIQIAVVRGGVVVARASGTVSANQNPSFTFAPGAVLQRGITHEVHYWIDSNVGGGTPGICDPAAIDHQWSTELVWPTNDVDFTVSYQLWLIEDVCDTFN